VRSIETAWDAMPQTLHHLSRNGKSIHIIQWTQESKQGGAWAAQSSLSVIN